MTVLSRIQSVLLVVLFCSAWPWHDIDESMKHRGYPRWTHSHFGFKAVVLLRRYTLLVVRAQIDKVARFVSNLNSKDSKPSEHWLIYPCRSILWETEIQEHLRNRHLYVRFYKPSPLHSTLNGTVPFSSLSIINSVQNAHQNHKDIYYYNLWEYYVTFTNVVINIFFFRRPIMKVVTTTS